VALPLTSESAPAAAALGDGDQLPIVELPGGDSELVARVRAAGDAALERGMLAAGGGRKGKRAEYRCASCGYGIVVSGHAPSCPMCREARWEHLEWRPFSQLLEFPLANLAHSVGRSVSRLAPGAPTASGR
jgi:hypothetical protein